VLFRGKATHDCLRFDADYIAWFISGKAGEKKGESVKGKNRLKEENGGRMISFSINVRLLYSDDRRYMFNVDKKNVKKDEKKRPFCYMPDVFLSLSLSLLIRNANHSTIVICITKSKCMYGVLLCSIKEN
jgi:hypothetical protein